MRSSRHRSHSPRLLLIALACAATFASNADGVAAAPLGAITEFSAGLNAGATPVGIAPGSDGNLWFTDNGATRAIGRITTSGAINEFSTGLNVGAVPFGIASGPDGNLWFTDTGTTKAIGRITTSGTINEFSAGLNFGAFPLRIAPGPDGNLWFTDRGTTKAIGRVTTSGAINEFSSGLNAGTVPTGIAPGPDGNLWFTDEGTTPAIGQINPSGTITEFSSGLNAGALPIGIAPGPDGNMWFADNGTTKAIGRITPSGAITEFSPGVSFPRDIAPGPDGNLIFTDEGGSPSAIGRISPSGTITEFSLGLNAGGQPREIAPGPDGNLWFTDEGSASAIGRFGTAASTASLVSPAVTGSGQQGTQHVCQGDRWATWAGQQPTLNPPSASPPGYQWLRDGSPLAGQTGQVYTPVAGDVGHALVCRVAVTYPLFEVTALAISNPVSVIPQSSGPQGPPGPPGRDATVSCKAKGKKVKCTVAFSSAAGVKLAKLSRDGVTYAAAKPTVLGGKLILRFTTRHRLEPGRYTLTVVQRLGGRRVVTESAVLLS